MERLRKNWPICALWLVLLLALQYCGVRSSAPYIMLPPAILLALTFFTRHIAVYIVFYLWIALVTFMGIWAAAHQLYESFRHYNIFISVICVILAASVAIWSYCQKHSK